jgi:hypothetical protein
LSADQSLFAANWPGRYAGGQEVVAVFIVDVALEHTCAEFRSQAADGKITVEERDLLIDGAILLAANIEELAQETRAGLQPAWADTVISVSRRSQRAA